VRGDEIYVGCKAYAATYKYVMADQGTYLLNRPCVVESRIAGIGCQESIDIVC
jgi:hypothetical protein